eukprot:TRINITY_DN8455_c0_g1_i1.p1 TRINITY_DN8455_c0_g1~~TRINITY_DN8455_c0_g1_i1.p1  ORF type:complete len:139 (-),score=5.16 TRINITY_DN8455_c0_g1_i1:148-564(-)
MLLTRNFYFLMTNRKSLNRALPAINFTAKVISLAVQSTSGVSIDALIPNLKPDRDVSNALAISTKLTAIIRDNDDQDVEMTATSILKSRNELIELFHAQDIALSESFGALTMTRTDHGVRWMCAKHIRSGDQGYTLDI